MVLPNLKSIPNIEKCVLGGPIEGLSVNSCQSLGQLLYLHRAKHKTMVKRFILNQHTCNHL